MKEKHLLTFVLLLWLFFPYGVFCQLPQEREERPLREEKLYQPTPTSKFSHRAGVFVGYDSNPRLSLERKGDVFEEFVYSLDYSKPLIEGLRLFFDYDLRFENYHEITDISNTLNHFRLGLDKKFSLCSVGVGYDAGLITYLNDDSDFLLHKGFVYLAKKIGAKTYHKLQFEQGAKDYFDISSLGDSLGSAQEKERLDRRLAARYSLSVRPNQKTKLGCEFEFSRNDSNARYLDFYDWLAYAPSASFDYQLLKDLYLLSRFGYRRKGYDSRTITNGTDKQHDNLYSGSVGVRVLLKEKDSLSLEYTYRDNDSNDDLQEYSENVITCGWQHNF